MRPMLLFVFLAVYAASAAEAGHTKYEAGLPPAGWRFGIGRGLLGSMSQTEFIGVNPAVPGGLHVGYDPTDYWELSAGRSRPRLTLSFSATLATVEIDAVNYIGGKLGTFGTGKFQMARVSGLVSCWSRIRTDDRRPGEKQWVGALLMGPAVGFARMHDASTAGDGGEYVPIDGIATRTVAIFGVEAQLVLPIWFTGVLSRTHVTLICSLMGSGAPLATLEAPFGSSYPSVDASYSPTTVTVGISYAP